jgi:hypothetical protein
MSSSQKGLKVIVKVEGTEGPGKISVKSETTDKTLSKIVDNIEGKYTFHFKADVVPVGGTFEACAYSFEKAGEKISKALPRKESCTKGVNGPKKSLKR